MEQKNVHTVDVKQDHVLDLCAFLYIVHFATSSKPKAINYYFAYIFF